MGNSTLKLSELLKNLGFLCVWGMMERCGEEWRTVSVGQPMTYDKNNGIQAVYDEEGFPWIKRTADIPEDGYGNEFRNIKIIRGCWVPFSNDGGEFARNCFDEILAIRKKRE